MKIFIIPAVAAALFLAGCDPHHNHSEHVELILNPSPPGPATLFELRFDQPMAGPEKIGQAAEPSPLVIEPPLRGVFTWISSRSGSFAPSEPLALGRRYELSLRPGLLDADGRRSTAALRRRVETPPFSVAHSDIQRDRENSDSEPAVTLVFNAPVRAGELAAFMEFRDAANERAPVELHQLTNDDMPWENSQSRLPAALVSNLVLATPEQPLPAGKDWRLILWPGLPAAEAGLRLRDRDEIQCGNVVPFLFERAIAHHLVDTGASMVLQFSKPVAPSLAGQWRRWINLEPAPSNIVAETDGRCLNLRGDFESETEYQLTVKSGLPADEPFTLREPAFTNVLMPAIPARLYFPAFSEDQQAAGGRVFPLLAVNVSSIHLRAKLLEPDTAIYALTGFQDYFRSWHDYRRNDEPYRRLDYNLIAGRTVFDEALAGAPRPDSATNIMLDWNRMLGGRKTGIVFIEAERAGEPDDSNPRLGAQALMQLTDLGLSWKTGAGRVDVFVFSQSTGRPAPGASARLFDSENQVLGETLTDTHGLAHLACPTNAQWLSASLGADFHALKIDAHGIPLYSFEIPFWWNGEDRNSRPVMIFSDREYYRPNETVHLKAVARDWTAGGLAIPAKLAGALECFDARGQSFFTTNVQFSGRGACSVDVPLPPAPCGEYTARFHLDGADYDHPFVTREFQPNPFEVTVQAKKEYQAEEKVELPLSARYYFGQPLSNARVKWTVEMEESVFKPAGYDAYTFYNEDSDGAHPAISGETRMSNSTGCVIAPEMPLNSLASGPRAVSLLVETTDLDQQTVSTGAQFICHSSDFYLGARQTNSLWTAGEQTPVQLIAIGAGGKPWPQTVAARLLLQRLDWEPVRVQSAGGAVRYIPQMLCSNVLERDVEIAGTTTLFLAAAGPGQYLLKISAADPEGRKVSTVSRFAVSAPGSLSWNYRDDFRMELQPDRPEYAPGDTARLLVKAPFSGVAWVTVEREKVLRSFSTRLDGNAPMLEIPLEHADSPNVFVSVLLTRGSEDCPRDVKEPEYRVGYCQLPVRDPATRLAVSVVCAATNYLPAAPVEVTVNVNNLSNAPVAGAEVTLYAVDEGILSLGDSSLPDPAAIFYAPRPLAVNSGISLPNLMTEDPEQRRFGNKGYTGGGGGRGRARKNFLACAFWNASLITGPQGSVTATFAAPDSVTRYRVMAVAHLNDAFGSGQSAFEVSKPLLIESALPQFARIGDRLIARAVVHNQSRREGKVTVKLELDDKARTGETEKQIQIPAGGSEVAEFPVTFAAAGTARWTWRAWFAGAPREFSDAVESSLDVGYVTPQLHQTIFQTVECGATNLFDKTDPRFLAGTGTVTLRVSNTRLIELAGAASALLHYPYGCAEQTGSSMIPWITLSDAPALRSVMGGRSNEAARAINYGIDRLFTMQTPGGGLGYWPRAREPMLWASAYGAMVLTLAKQHGWKLPGPQFDNLLSGLSAELRAPAGGDSLSDSCLALYALALAGRAEPAYHEKLFSQRGRLSPEDRALLALAILQSSGPAKMAQELLTTNRVSRRAVSEDFSCPSREMAIRLLAWIRLRPESLEVPAIRDALMAQQREAHWDTTQGDAWTLLALTEFARRVEGPLQPATGELRWNDTTTPFRLDAERPCFDATFNLTGKAEPSASILNASPRALYASAAFEIRPPGLAQPRDDSGFGLQRRYERLDGNHHPCGGALAVGDRVLVTLELSVRENARYVAVDDALPAILEPVPGAEEDWMWDYHEFRKDRALFFADNLPAGDYTLRYSARVRAAGEVSAPSGKVEEMYHPRRFGMTGTQTLEAK